MKKYAIVYLIRGDSEQYQRELMKDLSRRFGVPDLNAHIPPHITLKAPFEANKVHIRELKKVLSASRKTQKQIITLDGIGSFGTEVIYLNTLFSKGAQNTRKQLVERLKELDWMSWREYDPPANFHPHATLTYCQTPSQFTEFMKYLRRFNPRFLLQFDNLSLLEKSLNGNWKVNQEYKIK